MIENENMNQKGSINNIVLIVLAVALVGAIGAAGYFYFARYPARQEQPDYQTPAPMPVTEKKEIDTILDAPFPLAIKRPAMPVDTSGWKTFRSEKYGFEFKYPADMEIELTGQKNPMGEIIGEGHPYVIDRRTVSFDFDDKLIDPVFGTKLPCHALAYSRALERGRVGDIVIERRINLNDDVDAWQVFMTHMAARVVVTYISAANCGLLERPTGVLSFSRGSWPTPQEYYAILSTARFFSPDNVR
jgi:hypothetical protein